MDSKIEVSAISSMGPNCRQVLITVKGKMERNSARMAAFRLFLKQIGVNIEWEDGSGATGHKIKVFLNPERGEDQRKKILEFGQ